MAKAYTQEDFDELMGKVEKADFQVAEYLELAGRENLDMCVKYFHIFGAEPSTEYLYTVYDAGRRFIVNLDNKTCSCRMFQIDEIPCLHAWAVIKKKNLMADDYCSELFKSHTVVKTYDVVVDPLPDEREWNIPTYISEDVVFPPRYKRPPGRPKKKRDKPLFELLLGKKRHTCSTCGQTGQNRRSCSNAPRRK
ncbi:uncharacterized protein LOC132608147 [Lycium barbarum]|uniref:uncharacterized protein LOC132608147 n=1 Tax=Lycium barbarum TaxID=112863 RepID=UPI00293E9069|nr:uncharacterized protein LOC132608147 [Lycium barbarum]